MELKGKRRVTLWPPFPPHVIRRKSCFKSVESPARAGGGPSCGHPCPAATGRIFCSGDSSSQACHNKRGWLFSFFTLGIGHGREQPLKEHLLGQRMNLLNTLQQPSPAPGLVRPLSDSQRHAGRKSAKSEKAAHLHGGRLHARHLCASYRVILGNKWAAETFLYFPDNETKAQIGYVACSRSNK